MAKVCIITDSTAQFPTDNFPGADLVYLLSKGGGLQKISSGNNKGLPLSALPTVISPERPVPKLIPEVNDFLQIYTRLATRYEEILVILSSMHISPSIEAAKKAVFRAGLSTITHIVDSQTTAVGLGLLIQWGAAAAQKELQVVELCRLLRAKLAQIYTVLCLPNLTYLSRLGDLEPAQAVVGEMLGISPLYVLEKGQLMPVHKVKNARHLVDLLHEFLVEFDSLEHVALMHGFPRYEAEGRSLRERLNSTHPDLFISDHNINAAVASILGPRSFGLVAFDSGGCCD